jgi:formamidopyrimidine-DNA glycosylase
MPELPEVETIRRGLEKAILHKKIVAVRVLSPKSVLPSKTVFTRGLIGQKVNGIIRKGKYLVLGLSGGGSLIAHLRMTGQLISRPKKLANEPQRFSRVVLTFEGGSVLHFNDMRKFGRLEIASPERVKQVLARLGDDALIVSEAPFIKAMLRRKNAATKAALLDQELCAGVGNIYADEICHAVGILPKRAVKTLSENDLIKIHKAMKKILARSVRFGGTSISDYVDATGKKGTYEKHLQVYGKNGEACHKCGSKIQKNRLAGRGTHFCAKCQK